MPTTDGVAALVAQETTELTFAHVKTRPGAPEDLPRPTVTPIQVKERMIAWMKENA